VVLVDEALVQECGSERGSSLPLASPGRTLDQFKSDEASEGAPEKHDINWDEKGMSSAPSQRVSDWEPKEAQEYYDLRHLKQQKERWLA
jgi:hypothetical protein